MRELALFCALAAAFPATGQPFRFARTPESVTFPSGEVRLSGVLLEPEGRPPFPAVVLVHGAGPATHDEPAFVVHANAFLERGFAVLSYDKRGSGRSTGRLEWSGYGDLAADVGAAATYLRSRKEIAPARIGLLGRSEGAWVSALAASKDPAVAFIVMSSGSAVSPAEQVLWWTRTSLKAKGIPTARIEQAIDLKQSMWAFYRSAAAGNVDANALARTRASLLERSAAFADARPEVPSAIPDPATEDRRRFASFVATIDYDPGPAFQALRCPLLEAIGMSDDVVEPASTIAALERLRAAGRDVAILRLPDVGHSLLVIKDGRTAGYAPGYLESVVQWAADRVRPPAPRGPSGKASSAGE